MRKKKCNSSVNYSHFECWRFFFLVFCLFVHIVNELLRVCTLNNGAKLCGEVPCCWCILWFGLVHLDSARHKTSRRVSWCQLWVESEETESGEWCKNSLVKWWWGEWNLEPASNRPTRKIFILYFSQVLLLIPGHLPLLVVMKGHLSGCSA